MPWKPLGVSMMTCCASAGGRVKELAKLWPRIFAEVGGRSLSQISVDLCGSRSHRATSGFRIAQYAARCDEIVDLPAPPLPLITAITAMARTVDRDPEQPDDTAPFCAISLQSRMGIRPFPGRSTHLNWIARSAQASESRIVQTGPAKNRALIRPIPRLYPGGLCTTIT